MLPRKTRIRWALILLGAAIIINLIVLIQGDTEVGWPIAVMLILGAAGASLMAEHRDEF